MAMLLQRDMEWVRQWFQPLLETSMSVPKGVALTCVECGVEFRVPPSRAATASTCSNECGYKRRGKTRSRKVTLTCKHCLGAFLVPQCHGGRRVYCSVVCMEASTGIKGLKASRTGEANGWWQGGIVPHRDGYLYERDTHHPLATYNGYVLQHRLVMERWLIENDPESKFLVEREGRKVLSPDYEVHHRNEVRHDNRIKNLECMTPEEHKRHHHEVLRAALSFYRLHHPIGDLP